MAVTTDFKSFLKANKPMLLAPSRPEDRFPVMIRGRHGVGKSQVIYQTCDDLYWDSEVEMLGLKSDGAFDESNPHHAPYTMVERRASQMSEGDLLGIPSPDGFEINGEVASRFRPFEWLILSCTQPCVLFLDELDRASQEVRQGFFEMADSRKLAGWVLHPGTVVYSACNGGLNGANYQVSEMDPAELDRWTVFEVEPTVEDWLGWAEGRVHKISWDFINQNREHLEHTGDVEPNKVFPSRRSWVRCDKVLQASDLFGGKLDRSLMMTLVNGFVGTEAAISFVDFVGTFDKQVSIEEILDAGGFDKLKEWGVTEYTAFIEKMVTEGTLKEDLTETRAANVAELFAIHAPSEVSMKLWHTLSSSQEAGKHTNVVAFYHKDGADRVVSDGRTVREHMLEIMGQQETK